MKIKYYLIFTFLCVTYLTRAQSGYFLDSAIKYKLEEDFIKSSIFCERILFESQNESEVNTAFFIKMDLLKKQKLFAQVIQFIKQNINLIQKDSIKSQIYEQWILSCYLDNQYNEAISLVELSKNYFPQNFDTKWLNFLKILCLNNQNKWEESKLLCKDWFVYLKLDTNSVELIYANPPKLKNENTANWLATIFPGAGQIYTKNYREAFASILLQGIGVFYGVNSFQNKYYLSSWLVGLGTFGSFHFGGVRRSTELVRQYNLKKSYRYNNIIKSKLLEKFSQ